MKHIGRDVRKPFRKNRWKKRTGSLRAMKNRQFGPAFNAMSIYKKRDHLKELLDAENNIVTIIHKQQHILHLKNLEEEENGKE